MGAYRIPHGRVNVGRPPQVRPCGADDPTPPCPRCGCPDTFEEFDADTGPEIICPECVAFTTADRKGGR